MQDKQLEQLFHLLDRSAELISEEQELPYLDALALAGDKLSAGEFIETKNEIEKKKLKQIVEDIYLDELPKEVIRKSFQLTVLKGMKGATQPHHSLTPDAVSLFISYLVNKISSDLKSEYLVADFALGSGNLLSAVLNQSTKPARAVGFEADETLLHIAFVSSNLQRNEVELFHQDSIQNLPLLKADVVVTDLPVGYYPNDIIANDYELKAESGHSYVHHLMIEQAIQQTREGGYLYFLIPNFLFESDQSEKLHRYLKEKTHILALLQLPKSMFHSEQQAKSILMLQKKGTEVQPIQQALMAELPSFSKPTALADMIKQIDGWFKQELGK
ncbi:class I SAM-dependent methyltransferase [Alkalihalobacillus pseudalcaliphilus]|uniref:class I SAM-dependent methyltransferase n=1 Tax=Alkalihalobacillus pseudalcaliphilus TaxID=79884 RepID=UPI00064DECB0|nr:class I SAM-dependent methyltransferase [Alkalihalobacillus pseudalcaliphilus]KMK74534.1 DNA methylase [Alkalihalobacillus pseudalcaliphilus]